MTILKTYKFKENAMKKSELRQLIIEEINKVLKENIKLNKDEATLVDAINKWANQSDKNIMLVHTALFGKGSRTSMSYTISKLPKQFQSQFNDKNINKKNILITLTNQYGELGQDF